MLIAVQNLGHKTGLFCARDVRFPVLVNNKTFYRSRERSPAG